MQGIEVAKTVVADTELRDDCVAWYHMIACLKRTFDISLVPDLTKPAEVSRSPYEAGWINNFLHEVLINSNVKMNQALYKRTYIKAFIFIQVIFFLTCVFTLTEPTQYWSLSCLWSKLITTGDKARVGSKRSTHQSGMGIWHLDGPAKKKPTCVGIPFYEPYIANNVLWFVCNV